MAVLFSNNATTALTSTITAIATSITVDNASVFPAIASPDITYVTMVQGATLEVVKVTDITGNVLTVVRAQDGTSGFAFSAGDSIELRVTAALLNAAIPAIPGVATLTTAGLVEQSTSAENVAGTSDTVFPSVAGAKEIVDTQMASIGNVGDVTITTPSSGQALTYNGAAWVNGSGGGGIFYGDNGTTGSSGGDIFRGNNAILTVSETIPSTINASCTGPLSIDTGVTLTVEGVLVVL